MEGQNRVLKLQEKWNQRYLDAQEPGQATAVLAENQHLLPGQGKALDLASGLGANAILMANQGLQVEAWDLSDVALQKLQLFAKQADLQITTELRDVEAYPPKQELFDVIVVSHFLDRRTIPNLIDALKPEGIIYYQTFSQIKVDPDIGPSSARFTLAENELLLLFSALKVLVYREEGRVGDKNRGFRNEVMLVAQKNKGRNL